MIIEDHYYFTRIIAETKEEEEFIKTMTFEEKLTAMKIAQESYIKKVKL